LAENDFSLILGCGGFRYNDLNLCSGTLNVIINFSGHFNPDESDKIMDFLDHTCGLFDRPIGDWNKITNTLKMFYEQFKLIDDKMWQALYVWLPHHKRCGAYLKLSFNEDVDAIMKAQDVLILPEKLKR
jgi:hypothetical protein